MLMVPWIYLWSGMSVDRVGQRSGELAVTHEVGGLKFMWTGWRRWGEQDEKTVQNASLCPQNFYMSGNLTTG